MSLWGSQISYLGSGNPLVSISDQSVVDFLLGFSVARYNLRSTGAARYYREMDGGYTTIPNEWRMEGASADYEVRWTLNSGTSPTVLSGPAVGAWGTLNLGAEVQLSSTTGTISCELLCEIRLAASGVVLDSAVIVLSADGLS